MAMHAYSAVFRSAVPDHPALVVGYENIEQVS